MASDRDYDFLENLSGEMDFSGDRAEDLGLYDEFQNSRTRKKGSKNKKTKKEKKYRGRRSKETKPRSKKKTILTVLVCFLVLGLCGALLVNQYIQDKLNLINRIEVSDEDWDIDPQVAEDLADYKNIVLLGVDSRETKGETQDSAVRSDAIILVTINTKTNEVTLTSILRDSYLDLEENGYHVIDKVTHAHAYGGAVDTVRALNRNLDLNIDAFIRVDWRAVADVVDAMGGVEVTVTDAILECLNAQIATINKQLNISDETIAQAGTQTLNGTQTVAFCCIRKVDGDEARAARIRETLLAAFEAAKTLKLSELNNVINVGLSEITTSMDNSTMMGLLMSLTSYSMNDSLSFPFSWESGTINGVSYVVPNTLSQNVTELHETLFGQEDYEPTERVMAISEQIKYESGYYGGESFSETLRALWESLCYPTKSSSL